MLGLVFVAFSDTIFWMYFFAKDWKQRTKNKQQMYYNNKGLSLLTAILLLFSCSSCIKETPLPKPSDFDKKKREILGDLIKEAILGQADVFPILPNQAPFDTVYWYLQKLYDQATNSIRVDHQSPRINKWNFDRKWSVIILDNDADKIAFAVPGGHLFISTGFLKSLSREYELYYIFAFEASLMNHRYILNRLITEFNSQVLYDLSVGKTPSKNISPTDLAHSFFELKYHPEIVALGDQRAVKLICKSSLYDRTGLIPILKHSEDDDHWIRTRPSYAGRSNIENLTRYKVDGSCGTLKSNGGYKRYVWEKLP